MKTVFGLKHKYGIPLFHIVCLVMNVYYKKMVVLALKLLRKLKVQE